MNTVARMAALACVAVLVVGCGEDPPTSVEGAGGTAGTGGAGGGAAGSGGGAAGTGGNGSGGSGGSGGAPDTTWIDVRPDNDCTMDELGRVIGTGLEHDVARVGVYPRLAIGTSQRAVVERYEDDGARIVLMADEEVVINLVGVLGPMDFAVGSKVTLEQTQSWTIIRTATYLYAMFWSVGDDIPDGRLDPIPFGGPSLRFVLQCNRTDATTCAPEPIGLESGTGTGLQRYPSGERVVVGDWTVDNFTVLTRSCPQDPTAFRSMIVVEGRPAQ